MNYGRMKTEAHIKQIDEEIDRLIARLEKSQRKHNVPEDRGYWRNRSRALKLGVAIERAIKALEDARWHVKREI